MESVYKQIQKAPIMKSMHVYEILKEELFSGAWDFGEKILVNELIEKFNVSRRPVMDALKMLNSNGFIEIIPQSGCKVVEYSKKNVLDQLLLSSALESLGAELAATNHTDSEINSLCKYQENVKNNLEKFNDHAYYFKYNREIHAHIMLMTHSDKIQKHAIQLWDLTDFYLLNSLDKLKTDIDGSIKEHDQIIEAIKDKDKIKAKTLMERHIRSYMTKLKEQLP
ncbi:MULTISPECIES: GntR family transcriptional regulator [Priestia]|uniref:GntR family transcriptional regulator n=1 Tax=Priestia TaxID=2800373 RepID=UPI001ADB3DA6|nr:MULTISPECIES: GntR family transcriptional regulator [Priestia]MDN3233175.1 GntR family transcriptional regulator [Priestia megaterium]QTL52178.1 GntR family transcriptional regulator [Priestia aryabhattai]